MATEKVSRREWLKQAVKAAGLTYLLYEIYGQWLTLQNVEGFLRKCECLSQPSPGQLRLAIYPDERPERAAAAILDEVDRLDGVVGRFQGVYQFADMYRVPVDYELMGRTLLRGRIPGFAWTFRENEDKLFSFDFNQHKGYLTAIGRRLARMPGPVTMWFGLEINTKNNTWPYVRAHSGVKEEAHALAFKDFFNHTGELYRKIAPNVMMALSLTAEGNEMEEYYPGDKYVDRVGLTIYDWYLRFTPNPGHLTPRAPGEHLVNKLVEIKRFAGEKEIVIAEAGSGRELEVDASWWMMNMLAAGLFLGVEEVAWFRFNKLYQMWWPPFHERDWSKGEGYAYKLGELTRVMRGYGFLDERVSLVAQTERFEKRLGRSLGMDYELLKQIDSSESVVAQRQVIEDLYQTERL